MLVWQWSLMSQLQQVDQNSTLYCFCVSVCLPLSLFFSVSLSQSLSVSFSVCYCLYFSVCLSVCLTLSLFLCLSTSVSLDLCLCLCLLSLSPSLFLCLSLSLFFPLSSPLPFPVHSTCLPCAGMTWKARGSSPTATSWNTWEPLSMPPGTTQAPVRGSSTAVASTSTCTMPCSSSGTRTSPRSRPTSHRTCLPLRSSGNSSEWCWSDAVFLLLSLFWGFFWGGVYFCQLQKKKNHTKDHVQHSAALLLLFFVKFLPGTEKSSHTKNHTCERDTLKDASLLDNSTCCWTLLNYKPVWPASKGAQMVSSWSQVWFCGSPFKFTLI